MEFSNFQFTSSILNHQNKRKTNLRSKFISSYSFQFFSFPDPIMFYISKNPRTTKLYQKMIQTCKYFFIKNPIIVSSNFPYSLDFDKRCIGKTGLDFSQLICKYWITENFKFTSILPKLYKCDAIKVTISDQIISFNVLSIFTKTAEDIIFNKVTIKDSDGSIVSLEKIFKAFFNAKKFEFYSYSTLSNITSKTFNELLKIPHFSKLQLMSLNNIPDTFDIETFYVYLKKNNTTKFDLIFDNSISASYKIRLEEIIDEILSTEVFNYKVPFIDFDGLEIEKAFKLECICKFDIFSYLVE